MQNRESTEGYSREKGRDLTQSYDKSPYTNRNVKRAKWQHKQTPQKSSIKQRLRTDLGRSVGVKGEKSRKDMASSGKWFQQLDHKQVRKG